MGAFPKENAGFGSGPAGLKGSVAKKSNPLCSEEDEPERRSGDTPEGL
jgi:hypothetical protein